MFNEKNNVIKLFYLLTLCLLFSTHTKAFTLGDDIPDPALNWSFVTEIELFWYVDAGIVRGWICKSYEVNNNINGAHCSTSGGTKIKHFHFEHDIDVSIPYATNDIPNWDEVNAFWDYKFKAPDICSSDEYPTNQFNCYTLAAAWCLYGNYYYWINADQMEIILGEEAGEVTSNFEAGDIIFYNTHSSMISSVDEGGIVDEIMWKFRDSRLYYCNNNPSGSQIHALDTPMCGGEPTINGYELELQFFWSWSWEGAGDGSAATTKVFRCN